MKRPQRIIIGIIAASFTFATLTATVGTEHWKRGHYFHHGYYHHHSHDHDQDGDWNSKGNSKKAEPDNQ